LPEPQQTQILNEALTAIRDIKNYEQARAEELRLVMKWPPDRLPMETLQTVRSLCKHYESAEVLSYLAAHWSIICQTSNLSEFGELSAALSAFAGAGRKNLLWAIDALLPVIKELGGQKAVRETAQAIIDTARWWP
jgi:hypothetical protein